MRNNGSHGSRATWFLLLTLSILFGSIVTILPLAGAQAEGRLAVSGSPPSVPADGGAYAIIVVQALAPDGRPKAPTRDLTISLSSSTSGTGTPDAVVTIPTGATFAIATFTTTRTPGSTVITASAQGYAVNSTTIRTVAPNNIPSQLRLFVAPNSTVSSRSMTADAIVQLTDTRGVPSRTTSPIAVSLASSDPRVGTVNSSITIPGGETRAVGKILSGAFAGSTTISASASGYSSATAQFTVFGPEARVLKLFAAPPVVIAGNDTEGVLVVQLRDLSGTPARAPQPITVTFVSSNEAFVRVAGAVTIGTGTSTGVATFVPGAVGSAQITAVAAGFDAATTTVRVTRGAPTTSKVILYALPDILDADPEGRGSIVVQRVAGDGSPTELATSLRVELSSSAPRFGAVSGSVTIPAGRSYGTVSFNPTAFPGETSIVAVAPNITLSDPLRVSTRGRTPDRLSVGLIPSILAADGSSREAVLVELLGDRDQPARAPEDTSVQLSSSSSDVAEVPSTITIPQGATYGVASLSAKSQAGRTTISASASGLRAGSATATTIAPYPSKLALYAAPATVQTGGQSYDAVAVQLQDADGAPATPLQPVRIQLTSSSTGVGRIEESITIPSDKTFVRVRFNTTDLQGNTTITASAQGFASASIAMNTVSTPMTVVLTSSVTHLKEGETANVEAHVRSENTPLAGATVQWSSNTGELRSTTQVSDQDGRAANIVTARGTGPITVQATATSPGFTPATAAIPIEVTVPGILDFLTSTVGATLALAPIAALAIWVVYRNRNRAKPVIDIRTITGNLKAPNWDIRPSGLFKGKSGTLHQFSLIIAPRGSSPHALADLVVGPREVEEDQVLAFYAKAYDTGVKETILGVIPSLNEKGRNLAKFYNIRVLEAPTSTLLAEAVTQAVQSIIDSKSVPPGPAPEKKGPPPPPK